MHSDSSSDECDSLEASPPIRSSSRPPRAKKTYKHDKILQQFALSVQSLQVLLANSQALLQASQSSGVCAITHPAHSPTRNEKACTSKHMRRRKSPLKDSAICSHNARPNRHERMLQNFEQPIARRAVARPQHSRGGRISSGHRPTSNEPVQPWFNSRTHSISNISRDEKSVIGLHVSFPDSTQSLSVSFNRPSKPTPRNSSSMEAKLSVDVPLLAHIASDSINQDPSVRAFNTKSRDSLLSPGTLPRRCSPVRALESTYSSPTLPQFSPDELLTPQSHSRPSSTGEQDRISNDSNPGIIWREDFRLLPHSRSVGSVSPSGLSDIVSSEMDQEQGTAFEGDTDDGGVCAPSLQSCSSAQTSTTMSTDTVPRAISKWRSRHVQLLNEMKRLSRDISTILAPSQEYSEHVCPCENAQDVNLRPRADLQIRQHVRHKRAPTSKSTAVL
jgi:hypothetical protein